MLIFLLLGLTDFCCSGNQGKHFAVYFIVLLACHVAAEARKFHILRSAVSFKNSSSIWYQIHTSVFPWQIRVTRTVILKEKQGD